MLHNLIPSSDSGRQTVAKYLPLPAISLSKLGLRLHSRYKELESSP